MRKRMENKHAELNREVSKNWFNKVFFCGWMSVLGMVPVWVVMASNSYRFTHKGKRWTLIKSACWFFTPCNIDIDNHFPRSSFAFLLTFFRPFLSMFQLRTLMYASLWAASLLTEKKKFNTLYFFSKLFLWQKMIKASNEILFFSFAPFDTN